MISQRIGNFRLPVDAEALWGIVARNASGELRLVSQILILNHPLDLWKNGKKRTKERKPGSHLITSMILLWHAMKGPFLVPTIENILVSNLIRINVHIHLHL